MKEGEGTLYLVDGSFFIGSFNFNFNFLEIKKKRQFS